MDLAYLTNDVRVCRGGNQLAFFRLRVDAPSVNCVSSCCHTTLMIEHPSYQGRAVLVFPEIGLLSTCEIATAARVFTEDFPREQLVHLPKIDAPDEAWRVARDRELPDAQLGQRFQDILNESGGLVTVINL
jgi:hypothetical protein